MKPLISVIVPVYNVEKYLKRCLDSLACQTYPHFEVVLVDDGSEDGSSSICDEYVECDRRFSVVHQENAGLSAARNTGFRVSNGEFITFVDSDDYVDACYLDVLYKALSDSGSQLAICSFTVDTSETIGVVPGVYPGKELLKPIVEDHAWWYVVAWNKLYSRECLSYPFYPVGRINEDEFVIHRLLDSLDRVVICDDRLYHYKSNENSIMNKKISIRNLDKVLALLDRFSFFFSRGYFDLLNSTMRDAITIYVSVVGTIAVDGLTLSAANKNEIARIGSSINQLSHMAKDNLTTIVLFKSSLLELFPIIVPLLWCSFLKKSDD